MLQHPSDFIDPNVIQAILCLQLAHSNWHRVKLNSEKKKKRRIGKWEGLAFIFTDTDKPITRRKVKESEGSWRAVSCRLQWRNSILVSRSYWTHVYLLRDINGQRGRREKQTPLCKSMQFIFRMSDGESDPRGKWRLHRLHSSSPRVCSLVTECARLAWEIYDKKGENYPFCFFYCNCFWLGRCFHSIFSLFGGRCATGESCGRVTHASTSIPDKIEKEVTAPWTSCFITFSVAKRCEVALDFPVPLVHTFVIRGREQGNWNENDKGKIVNCLFFKMILLGFDPLYVCLFDVWFKSGNSISTHFHHSNCL